VLWLMAAVFVVVDSHLSARVARVEGWPTTDALVVVNKMEIVDGLNPNTGKWDKALRLTLEYTYEVDGRSYTGKNVNAPGTGARFADSEYPVGSRMPVRYDPNDPSVAGVKLDLKTAMNGHWFIYASTGIASLGLILATFAARSLLRQRAAMAQVMHRCAPTSDPRRTDADGPA